LVPATEDEVLQFGHLLDDGKVEDLPSVEDIFKVESFLLANVLCTDKSDLEGIYYCCFVLKQVGHSMHSFRKAVH
jgi:hypothetical protein